MAPLGPLDGSILPYAPMTGWQKSRQLGRRSSKLQVQAGLHRLPTRSPSHQFIAGPVHPEASRRVSASFKRMASARGTSKGESDIFTVSSEL